MAEVMMPDDTIASEFAAVQVTIDRRGNGPRLRLEDLREHRVAYLDAMALSTLVWLPDGLLEQLHDPAIRWREDDGTTQAHPAPATLSKKLRAPGNQAS